eukprot:365344-Chlamydomonas_euryale.AAC.17
MRTRTTAHCLGLRQPAAGLTARRKTATPTGTARGGNTRPPYPDQRALRGSSTLDLGIPVQ